MLTTILAGTILNPNWLQVQSISPFHQSLQPEIGFQRKEKEKKKQKIVSYLKFETTRLFSSKLTSYRLEFLHMQ